MFMVTCNILIKLYCVILPHLKKYLKHFNIFRNYFGLKCILAAAQSQRYSLLLLLLI